MPPPLQGKVQNYPATNQCVAIIGPPAKLYWVSLVLLVRTLSRSHWSPHHRKPNHKLILAFSDWAFFVEFDMVIATDLLNMPLTLVAREHVSWPLATR